MSRLVDTQVDIAGYILTYLDIHAPYSTIADIARFFASDLRHEPELYHILRVLQDREYIVVTDELVTLESKGMALLDISNAMVSAIKTTTVVQCDSAENKRQFYRYIHTDETTE